MPHLRVDPAYYERIPTHDLTRSFTKWQSMTLKYRYPCTFHNCEMIDECKTNSTECFAFRAWVNNGEKYLTEKNAKGEIKCLKKMGRLLEPLK